MEFSLGVVKMFEAFVVYLYGLFKTVTDGMDKASLYALRNSQKCEKGEQKDSRHLILFCKP